MSKMELQIIFQYLVHLNQIKFHQAYLKQRLVDIKRAQEKTSIIKEQSERQKEAEEAQIISEQEIKNAKIAQQRNIDSHRIESEKEVRTLDIEKAKRIQIEEHQKELEIIEKSKEVLASKAEEQNTRAKCS